MNRLYKSILALCCLSVVFFTSCQRSYNDHLVTAPAGANESMLNQLFSALRPAPQNLSVTAGFLQTVYGANGTKLTFYPNSFKDGNGNTITKGVIDIQLTEVYSPAAMLACRATTTSNGQLLSSGGEVLITATLNGQAVFANKYGIGFKQPAASAQPMSLFYGDTNNPDSVVAWGSPGAVQAGTFAPGTISYSDTSVVIVITSSGPDTVTTHGAVIQYYQFDSCANFNWINCDYFYTSGTQLTDISVTVPDSTFNQSNSEVFLIFPSINAAAHMSQYTTATHTFDLPAGYYVPVGMPVDIVVATNKNGTYYYFQQTGITTTSGMNIFASMPQATLSSIRSQLLGL